MRASWFKRPSRLCKQPWKWVLAPNTLTLALAHLHSSLSSHAPSYLRILRPLALQSNQAHSTGTWVLSSTVSRARQAAAVGIKLPSYHPHSHSSPSCTHTCKHTHTRARTHFSQWCAPIVATASAPSSTRARTCRTIKVRS